jgi:hypothetical protein
MTSFGERVKLAWKNINEIKPNSNNKDKQDKK